MLKLLDSRILFPVQVQLKQAAPALMPFRLVDTRTAPFMRTFMVFLLPPFVISQLTEISATSRAGVRRKNAGMMDTCAPIPDPDHSIAYDRRVRSRIRS